MRFIVGLFLLVCMILAGCGGASPEEADTSHLTSKTAEDGAAAARGRYENATQDGPAQ